MKAQYKKGDPYRLPCGHTGKVFMVLDSDTIVVKGPIRGNFCRQCNPRSSRKHPTAFIIQIETKDL